MSIVGPPPFTHSWVSGGVFFASKQLKDTGLGQLELRFDDGYAEPDSELG